MSQVISVADLQRQRDRQPQFRTRALAGEPIAMFRAAAAASDPSTWADPIAYLRSGAPQTPEICAAAVLRDGCALEYVHEQTLGICMAAMSQNIRAFKHVRVQTPELARMAVEEAGWMLKHVQQDLQSDELCMLAIGHAIEEGHHAEAAIALIRDPEQQQRLRHRVAETKFRDTDIEPAYVTTTAQSTGESTSVSTSVEPAPAPDPSPRSGRERLAPENGHGCANDRTYELCISLNSTKHAHDLVEAWAKRQRDAARKGGDLGTFDAAAAESIFTPAALRRLKIKVEGDDPIDWRDVAGEFAEIASEALRPGARDAAAVPPSGVSDGAGKVQGAPGVGVVTRAAKPARKSAKAKAEIEPVAGDAPAAAFEEARRPVAVRARKIAHEVMVVLRECSATDEGIFLPPRQLDPKLYKSVAAVIAELGGKWNKKMGGHKCSEDPRDLLRAVQMTGEYVSAKDFGFFPTQPPEAERAAELADLKPGMKVLEPSAGRGALANEAAKIVGKENVDVIELLDPNREVLEREGYTLVGRDFLAIEPKPIYDRLILNPPFEGMGDAKHVMHATRFLKPDGKLVAIMSPSWQFRQAKVAESFRELFKAAEGEVEEIAKGAFRDAGTDVSTVMITIDAAKLPWNREHADESDRGDEGRNDDGGQYERARG